MDKLEAEQRSAVVAEAWSWVRTPYHHEGRIKDIVADCAGVPLEVYAAVGVIPPTDVGSYAGEWFLHRSEETYLGWVEKFGRPIPVEAVQPGDFMLFRFGRTYSHGGIVIDAKGPKIIHAYRKARMVTVDDVSVVDDLWNRPQLAFTFWGEG